MTLFQPPQPPGELPAYRPTAAPPVPMGGPAQAPLQPLFPVPAPPPGTAPYQRQDWWTPVPIAPRPKRDWSGTDRVTSVILLSFALVGGILGVVTALVLPTATAAVYAGRGEDFVESGGSGHALALLLWSHVTLFVVVLVATIVLLRRRRVAFWVPLVGGVFAAVIFWIVVVSYAIADHTMRYVA